jgi:hypothetical protein
MFGRNPITYGRMQTSHVARMQRKPKLSSDIDFKLTIFNRKFCVLFAETLKFYRALHTVGTDFLLMQSIFPKRTRYDLKTKFKREDRTNRFLVEKALRSPLNFDLTELEKDMGK